jgi:hypothetical protein
MTKAEQAQVESRINALSAEAATLEESITPERKPDDVALALEAELGELMGKIRAAVLDEADMVAEVGDNQRMKAEAEAAVDRLEQALAEAKQRAEAAAKKREAAERTAAELAKAAIELRNALNPSAIVQTAVLPVLSPTRKRQVGLYVRYGRIYPMHCWSATGERLGPDPDHFMVIPGKEGTQRARARPDAGYPIESVEQTAAILKRLLQQFPKDSWAVGMVVYEDSFAQFQIVKAALVTLGHQYHLLSAGPDMPISDHGGDSRAQ